MLLMSGRRIEPDETNWHREGRGCWVRNDGLARVRKVGRLWMVGLRKAVGEEWIEDRGGFDRLWAAQSEAMRRRPI